LDLTGKPITAVTGDDVLAFVAGAPPEGDTLELKETLPATSRGEADPWARGEDRIGDRARNELLAEVIAFANAHGGMLLLGVSETDDRPKRAKQIEPGPLSRLRTLMRQADPEVVEEWKWQKPTSPGAPSIFTRATMLTRKR
jgi:hypothetical protein